MFEKSFCFLGNKSVKEQSLPSILHSQFARPLMIQMVVDISEVEAFINRTLLQEAGQLLPMIVQGPGNLYKLLANPQVAHLTTNSVFRG